MARCARSLQLSGWVRNSTQGVDIVASGEKNVLQQFAAALQQQAPAAARIVSFECRQMSDEHFGEFSIVASDADASRDTLVSPDLATCPDCQRELFDPQNRRYRYPFINCTNCGPRFTIINDLPYDRPATAMAPFEMCPSCAREYADEADRRYHAQPDACFDCGPQLWGCGPDGERTWAGSNRAGSDALIDEACRRLTRGEVLAIKGLGGWHLACDATNEQAVAALRQRKHRPSKPLAIMVATLACAESLCEVSDEEAQLLESPAHPIVLMPRAEGARLANGVAGDLPEVGIMLPSTPLQHLVCRQVGRPLVMTSGNRSGEPIVADDDDALDALGSIADWFLGNNRAIVASYDDSVARVLACGSVQMVRRARGYAPSPLLAQAPASAKRNTPAPTCIFAAGPEQKATMAWLTGQRAYISQHLGDLETAGSWHAWETARQRYEQLFGLKPDAIACDLHPEYLSSKWARAHAAATGLPLIEVQHHHAHIASVLGENNITSPVIGVALDGTGYGEDGTIWGGEILIATRSSFTRFWHLPTFPLPGGAAAIHDPRRTAFGLLWQFDKLDDPRFAAFLEALGGREVLGQMLERGINSPMCSSTGRLFDGVAALMGLCTTAGYDGEPACLLEAQARHELQGGMELAPLESGAPLTASGLHASVAKAIIEQCKLACAKTGIRDVALSGGCMVNRLLGGIITQGLEDAGFSVYTNRELPPNDGCIAYGQAIVAAARLEGE